MDLDEYAQKFPASRGRTCFVCGLEQREEIDKGLREDMSPTVIARWLQAEHGLTKMSGRLQHHIASGHHQ